MAAAIVDDLEMIHVDDRDRQGTLRGGRWLIA
jgi:hypothetical protein